MINWKGILTLLRPNDVYFIHGASLRDTKDMVRRWQPRLVKTFEVHSLPNGVAIRCLM